LLYGNLKTPKIFSLYKLIDWLNNKKCWLLQVASNTTGCCCEARQQHHFATKGGVHLPPAFGWLRQERVLPLAGALAGGRH
jgi:hypothetical protein